ncbi:TonB-dependent receptor [Salegentibacter chungangensis]|uniref:TonB-dependent receptor domain-containing protein n=1 Tax=Salegentibacter chungangensis TaxID=1335724 RepID=A0ABW3NTH6_9FLAO
MKLIYTCMLLLAAYSSAYSQNSFSGIVKDLDTGEPIFSATVYFPQLEKGTVTEMDGSFSLSNLPEGKYKLVISTVGYASFSEEIRVPSETRSFSLKPAAVEMEEVIISTPFHQLQSDNVMKVERENMKELNKKGALNLSDGITQIAGVESVTTGVGIGKPVIRGLSSNRVLVYTQGIRLENQQYGDEHGLGISAKGIGSIEVIKGPASLLYGSDAIGGVLYLNPESYAYAGKTEAEAGADYFSNTRGYQASAMAKTSGKKLKFLTRGSYAAHSDYKTGNDIRVTNTRFSEKDLKAGIGFQESKYKGNLRYNYNQSEIGIPEEIGIQSTDKDVLLPYQKIDNHILSLDNSIYLKNSSLNLKLGYQFNNRKEFEEEHEGEEHSEEEHTGEGPALEMHLETLNYNLQYNLPKTGNFETILGLQGMEQNNSNFGEEILIPDARTSDIGVFATTHYHLENWDLQGGLRYDHRNIDSEEFGEDNQEHFIPAVNRDFNSLNGALGVKYQFDRKLITRLNLATGFRAPNLSELTSNGVHHGANRYETGNTNLKNEQNFQVDLSVEWRNKHFEASVNAFHNQVNDYIFLDPTGETIENSEVFEYTQQDARLYGGEAGVHIHPHPLDWLHLESSFEMVTGKLQNDEYLPLIPASSLTNTLRVELENKNEKITEKYGFLRLKNVFAKENISRFETTTPAYALLSVGFGSTVNLSSSKIDFSISGTNLLDKAYISHLSRLKSDNIANIGRNIKFSVSWNL